MYIHFVQNILPASCNTLHFDGFFFWNFQKIYLSLASCLEKVWIQITLLFYSSHYLASWYNTYCECMDRFISDTYIRRWILRNTLCIKHSNKMHVNNTQSLISCKGNIFWKPHEKDCNIIQDYSVSADNGVGDLIH